MNEIQIMGYRLNYIKRALVFIICLNGFFIYGQDTIVVTYTVNDIPTSYDTYESSCNGPITSLTATLPSGDYFEVTNVEVSYTMSSLGSAFKSHQRSKIRCSSSDAEEIEVAGTGDVAGVQNYNRSMTIANGVYAGGSELNFEMWARRTFEGTPGCNSNVVRLDVFSWTLTIYVSAEVITPKVGINIDSPETHLDIRSAGINDFTELNIGNPNNERFTQINTANSPNQHSNMSWNKDQIFAFGTKNSDSSDLDIMMLMDTSGNIGIGTADPDAKLDVSSAYDAFAAIRGVSQNQYGIYGESMRLFGDSYGVYGKANNTTGIGVYGIGATGVKGFTAFEDGNGIIGESLNSIGEGNGVYGKSYGDKGAGVYGESSGWLGYGVHGESSHLGGNAHGVFGKSMGTGAAIYGTNSNSGGIGIEGRGLIGVRGFSYLDNGIAVQGDSDGLIGGIGVRGTTEAGDGQGVIGINWAYYGSAIGVHGQSFYGTGVQGIGETGVEGTGSTTGVIGQVQYSMGYGVRAINTATSGDAIALYAETQSDTGKGVYGYASSVSGYNYGVYGESTSDFGTGVYGKGKEFGVYAESINYVGLYATGWYGIDAYGESKGIRAESTNTTGDAIGVEALASSNIGIGVQGTGYHGVKGISNLDGGIGVYGRAYGEAGSALNAYSTGLYGKGMKAKITSTHSSANAILSESGGGDSYAAYLIGKVHVVGALSKSSGTFKIDHPLEPENKYLYHSFVESPDMMNIYNGNITTDGEGIAKVILPDYFDALNIDFRYQLTVIGTFAQAIIATEIQGNHFEIMTDKPNVKVSWQVTGVRNDPYAQANRIQVEVEKESENTGKYLHPEVYGLGKTKRIGYTEELQGEKNMMEKVEKMSKQTDPKNKFK